MARFAAANVQPVGLALRDESLPAPAIARYVQTLRSPEDRGGNGLGHLGPIPEGLVAWLVGLLAILVVVRWIGERA